MYYLLIKAEHEYHIKLVIGDSECRANSDL